jgi:hypothetical protein
MFAPKAILERVDRAVARDDTDYFGRQLESSTLRDLLGWWCHRPSGDIVLVFHATDRDVTVGAYGGLRAYQDELHAPLA